jgi:hypothetical protein
MEATEKEIYEGIITDWKIDTDILQREIEGKMKSQISEDMTPPRNIWC